MKFDRFTLMVVATIVKTFVYFSIDQNHFERLKLNEGTTV